MKVSGADGVQVYVDAQGPEDGPPVVFLHGVTGSGRTWGWLPETVTRGRRVMVVDLRGHGRSDHAPGTYDVDRYGADVVAVLRSLCGGRPAVLVGHSLGGTVAWWVAQRHPELVAGAFLEDPPLLGGDLKAPESRFIRQRFELLRNAVLAERARGATEEDVRRRLAVAPFRPDGTTLGELAFEDGVAAMAFGHHRMDIGVLEGAIDGSTLAPLDVESPVEVPVFVLAADDDFGAVFTRAHEATLASKYPTLEVARVVGAGHGIHDEREHREGFTERLSRFLDRHARSSA